MMINSSSNKDGVGIQLEEVLNGSLEAKMKEGLQARIAQLQDTLAKYGVGSNLDLNKSHVSSESVEPDFATPRYSSFNSHRSLRKPSFVSSGVQQSNQEEESTSVKDIVLKNLASKKVLLYLL